MLRNLTGKGKLRSSEIDITVIALGPDAVHFRIYLNQFWGEKSLSRELYDKPKPFSLLNNFSEEIAPNKNLNDLVCPLRLSFCNYLL